MVADLKEKGIQKTAWLGNYWYLNDSGRTTGPHKMFEIARMVDERQVTTGARICRASDHYWVPVTQHFPKEMLVDIGQNPLLLSKYDAMFYLGIFVFIAGIILAPCFCMLPLILFPTSLALEIYALHLEKKNRPASVELTLGNFIAYIWVGIQVVIIAVIIVLVGGAFID